jgi:hypothetical protein
MYNYKLNNILSTLEYKSHRIVIEAIQSIDCSKNILSVKVLNNHPKNIINNLIDCFKAINRNIRIQILKHETHYELICNWDLGDLIVPDLHTYDVNKSITFI